uniref:Uncharacterized protein n=1 Tax=Callithrix jacchus TaxID=9483 RepID=A0A8I3WXR7_CALJA
MSPWLANKNFLFVEIDNDGHYVAQAGLEPLASSDPPVLGSQSVGITDACHHDWPIFVFLVETGFPHVGQTCLELLSSGNPPALASYSAEITGMSPCTLLTIFKENISIHLYTWSI